MAAAPSILCTLTEEQLNGGLGSEPEFAWRIATHSNSLIWFRLDFLGWEHRHNWIPVWGAKAIYMRSARPLTLIEAHHQHRLWHDYLAQRNPELCISTELTIQIELLTTKPTQC